MAPDTVAMGCLPQLIDIAIISRSAKISSIIFALYHTYNTYNTIHPINTVSKPQNSIYNNGAPRCNRPRNHRPRPAQEGQPQPARSNQGKTRESRHRLQPRLPSPFGKYLILLATLLTAPQYRPARPLYLQDVYAIRDHDREYTDAGTRADKNKVALFSAAREVKNLTAHIGTEIIGLQLKDLTDQQRDELALLIAERSVVFFRDQDLSPQKQLELGKYFGEVEIHPQVPHVPGLQGTTVIWPDLQKSETGASFRKPIGTQGWHTDL